MLFTHGATGAIDVGNGTRDDNNAITMTSVKSLERKGSSLSFIQLFACNTGYSNTGIGQALANQLGVTVRAPTRGMDFSPYPDRLSGNKVHPATGSTFMTHTAGGTWRDFSRQ